MTAWQPNPDRDTPQDDLGGHDYVPTFAEASAMTGAGLGGPREKRIVARGNARNVYEEEFNLTGRGGGSPDSPGKAMARRAARASGALAAMDEGFTPAEIAARFRARDERKNAS